MATSTCMKCGRTQFEMVTKDGITGSNYKLLFVQCASCGGVVGVMDFYDTSDMLEKLAKKLGVGSLHGY